MKILNKSLILLGLIASINIGYAMEKESPLHEAAKKGDVTQVKTLIEEGANINEQDAKGRTPLHWATEKGHPEVVEALIEAGADTNIEDENGERALQLVIDYDRATKDQLRAARRFVLYNKTRPSDKYHLEIYHIDPGSVDSIYDE